MNSRRRICPQGRFALRLNLALCDRAASQKWRTSSIKCLWAGCPFRVIFRLRLASRPGPFLPQQRTCDDCIGMSVSCQQLHQVAGFPEGVKTADTSSIRIETRRHPCRQSREPIWRLVRCRMNAIRGGQHNRVVEERYGPPFRANRMEREVTGTGRGIGSGRPRYPVGRFPEAAEETPCEDQAVTTQSKIPAGDG